jgi:hypothetical protein
MEFTSIQRLNNKDTWAVTWFVLWIVSVGIIINHTGGRTDIFFTIGIIPFSFSLAFGLTHFIKL